MSYYWLIPAISIIVIVGLLMTRKKQKKINHFQAKLVHKEFLTHDSIVFTFKLPQKMRYLGIGIGEHIKIHATINNQQIQRSYTPISSINEQNSFHLLIKIYNKCEKFPQGGILTQWLAQLQLETKIDISAPYGKFNYNGQCRTTIRQINNLKKQKYERFFMIAGGTGITPIYQLINYITNAEKNVTNKPELILLFANRTEDDILLEHELKNLQKLNSTFKLYFSIDLPKNKDWEGLTGFIDEQKMQMTLPKNNKKTLFMSCGPPILCNIVENLWTKKFGIPSNKIFRF